MAAGADVNLGIDIEKKGQGDKEAATGLELVAKAADNAADELRQLDRKLLETRAAMVAAGKTFAQTGDISPFKQAIKDQREIVQVRRSLMQLGDDSDKAAKRMRAAFEAALSDKKSGIFGFFKGGSIANELIPQMQSSGLQAGTVFAGGFRGALVSLAGPIGLVVGPPLVAAIGASIAGATLSGLGLGAIAAGVALQFSRPEVKGAAADLGAYLKSQLTDATSGFGDRFIVGLQALRRESEPLWTGLRAGLQSLEPYVGNLLARLGEGLGKLGPGLQKSLEAAGPALGAIAKNLPTLLNAVSIFLEQVSKGGKGAAEAIDAISKTIAVTVAGTGFAIHGLTAAFETMVTVADKATGILGKIPVIGAPWAKLHDYVHGVATSFEESQLAAGGAAAGLFDVTGAANAASGAFATLSRDAKSVFDTFMSVDQAAIAVRAAMASLEESIRSNGTSLDINTDKGRANAQALLAGAQAAEQQREAMIESGKSAAYANQVYQDNIATLIRDAVQHGITAQAVENLIGKYRSVPGNVTTGFQTPGLLEAIGNARGLRQALDAVDGRIARASVVTTYLTIRDEITGGSAGPRRGVDTAQAFGGIVAAARGLIANGPTVLFGERTLPEAYIPAPNSGITQQRADALLGTAASWWGRRLAPAGGAAAQPQTVVLELSSDGGAAADLVLELLRKAVKPRGGNVQMIVAGKAAQ